jgi:hypothetical protein
LRVAIAVGGGWDFVDPRAGWTAWVEDSCVELRFDGVAWQTNAMAVSGRGAGTFATIHEAEATIMPGATVTVPGIIPEQALVIGVTARVTQAITGTLAAWSLGVPGSPNRYGSGLGLPLASFARGLTGTPVAYYSPSDLLLTAEGGVFGSGKVLLCIHCLSVMPPRVP